MAVLADNSGRCDSKALPGANEFRGTSHENAGGKSAPCSPSNGRSSLHARQPVLLVAAERLITLLSPFEYKEQPPRPPLLGQG